MFSSGGESDEGAENVVLNLIMAGFACHILGGSEVCSSGIFGFLYLSTSTIVHT